MALADTVRAIGKVTEWLRMRLEQRTQMDVTVGRPEPSKELLGTRKSRLNLFLYEAHFDPSLKNLPLDEGKPPPLWLTLKYLITGFDDTGESDTAKAHENLSVGLSALQELNFLPSPNPLLHPNIYPALEDNPEVLKITFDATPADLLSKLMQGTDEKYRFSMSFQVRPVMVVADELPSYSLLVGVDHTQTPAKEIGEKGIQIPVLPSMGPTISEVVPPKFQAKDELTIHGTDLHLAGLAVRLGPATFAVTAQRPNNLQCVIEEKVLKGDEIGAGSHPLCVVQTLPAGRLRSSNLLIAALRPTLEAATPSSFAVSSTPPKVFGDIAMTGLLLGRNSDDIFVALYSEDEVVNVFDAPFTFTNDQTSLTLKMKDADAVVPGDYRLIIRVNGQQAINSPKVKLGV